MKNVILYTSVFLCWYSLQANSESFLENLQILQHSLINIQKQLLLSKESIKPKLQPNMTARQAMDFWGPIMEKYGFEACFGSGYVFLINKGDQPIMKGLRGQDTLLDALIAEGERKRLVNLVKQYKIHLMPKDEDISTVFEDLLSLIVQNKELQNVVNLVKVKQSYGTKKDVEGFSGGSGVFPRIVIYPADGKQNAQKALDIIYDTFKTTKGLAMAPRFNAKVTDLIYVAQGDGDHKRLDFLAEYYEQPNRVYYNSKIMPLEEGFSDYYLKFPGTTISIVS